MLNNKKISCLSTPLACSSLLVILAFMLSACSDLVDIDEPKGKGEINFHIVNTSGLSKDLTGLQESFQKSVEGLEEVNIDVLELHTHYRATQTDTTQNGSAEGEWIEIPIVPGRVDLLELSGADADSLVAEAELEEGFYSQVRLILGEDNDVVINGETHPLETPSAQQSGFKVEFGKPLHSNEELDVTIEFDAEQSIVETGNGRYILKPVWHIRVD